MDHLLPDEDYYPVLNEMLKDLEGKEIVITISDEISEEKESNEEGVYKISGTAKMKKDESKISRELYHS